MLRCPLRTAEASLAVLQQETSPGSHRPPCGVCTSWPAQPELQPPVLHELGPEGHPEQELLPGRAQNLQDAVKVHVFYFLFYMVICTSALNNPSLHYL